MTKDIVRVVVCTGDVPNTFSKIVGALVLADVSVIDASAYITTDNKVLDTFWVQNVNGDAFCDEVYKTRIKETIQQAFHEEIDVCTKIKAKGFGYMSSRLRAIHVPSHIMIDNVVSESSTLIEVIGRDVPGLLYHIASIIGQENLQIISAHVVTYGVRAVDVFYVQDRQGQKITDKEQLARVRGTILSCLKEVCVGL